MDLGHLKHTCIQSTTDETTNQQKAYTAESFKLYLGQCIIIKVNREYWYKNTNILLTSTVWGWGTLKLMEIA